MSNMVTFKQGEFYYQVPMHEFARYWISNPIELVRLPNDIPMVSKMAALKRGKGVKRVEQAYSQKGSGKHDPFKDTV